MTARSILRQWVIVFCAAVGTYLVDTLVAALLVPHAAALANIVDSRLLRALIAVGAFDLSKLVGLAPAAWLLGGWLAARPIVTAAALVTLVFAIEAAMIWVLGLGEGLLSTVPLLATRAAALVALVFMSTLIVRWRQSRTDDPPRL